jgi:hypothetical protein
VLSCDVMSDVCNEMATQITFVFRAMAFFVVGSRRGTLTECLERPISYELAGSDKNQPTSTMTVKVVDVNGLMS